MVIIPDGAVLEEDVDERPADVGAAEAVHEEVAGEAQQLQVVGHRAEDREPDLRLEVLERRLRSFETPRGQAECYCGSVNLRSYEAVLTSIKVFSVLELFRGQFESFDHNLLQVDTSGR